MHDPQRHERGFTVHTPIDGVQRLDTDRFSLSWRPATAESLGSVGLAGFQMAVSTLMGQLREEHSGDPARVEAASSTRSAVEKPASRRAGGLPAH